jgi:Mn-containing catalase
LVSKYTKLEEGRSMQPHHAVLPPTLALGQQLGGRLGELKTPSNFVLQFYAHLKLKHYK